MIGVPEDDKNEECDNNKNSELSSINEEEAELQA